MGFDVGLLLKWTSQEAQNEGREYSELRTRSYGPNTGTITYNFMVITNKDGHDSRLSTRTRIV